ncbi:MAG: hypothetical protein AAFQ51_19275, partial [Pseudomonadota bacterium]
RVPLKWDSQIDQIFPHATTMDRRAAHGICVEVLELRNRIAHHEPLIHLPLDQRYRDLQRIVGAMCPATYQFTEANCTFLQVNGKRP